MTAPPQLKALCDNLTIVDGSDFGLIFGICIQKVNGISPAQDVVAEVEAKLSAAGLHGKERDEFLKACSFLSKQASSIDASKLAPRLKPLGFSDDVLSALENALHSNASPPELAGQVEHTDHTVELDPEIHHTAEDIDRMAREMMESDEEEEDMDAKSDASSVYSDGSVGSDVDVDLIAQFRSGGGEYSGTEDSESDYSDYESEEDAEVDDIEIDIANELDAMEKPGAEAEAEPEPETAVDTVPTDIISRLPADEMLFIIRALETHLSGGNLSKDEIVEIGKIAKRHKIPFRALQRMLRLMKTVVEQVQVGEITVKDDSGASNASGIVTGHTPIEFQDDEKIEDRVSERLRLVVPTMQPKAQSFLVDVALRLLRQDQSIVKPSEGVQEETVDADGAVSVRSWLLVETAKGVWQKRWFVVGSGKLEMFYSPESSSDDDRIYSIPLSVTRIVAQPKTVRPEAPYAFRISIKDVKKVIGDEVTKLIVNPETVVEKERWMEIFLRAKMGEADRSGYLGHEIVHPLGMKKWTRFENRWFVVDDGRIEIYKTASHSTEGKFLTIIPLQFCSVVEETKSKRPGAPHCFRINVTPNNETIGAKLMKIVLDPKDIDNKEEWLQSFALCSLAAMPDEIKTLAEPDPDSDEEPPPPEIRPEDTETFDDWGRRKGDAQFGVAPAAIVLEDEDEFAMFDHCGRPRGDPDFGQPAGVDSKKKKRAKPMDAPLSDANDDDDGSTEDDDDDEEEDDDEDDSNQGAAGRAGGTSVTVNLGAELVSGSMGAEITGKGKKFKSRTRRWFVLREKYLCLYKDEESIDDALSMIPLPLCQVRERPKTKRKKEPNAFRMDITNSMKVVGNPISKMILDPGDLESRNRWLDNLFVAIDIPAAQAAQASAAFKPMEQTELGAVKQAVADSVQEYDAVEVYDGDDEREVKLRLTLCGLAVLDATDTSVLYAYYPHDTIARFEESNVGTSKTALVSVTSRVSERENELMFIMKDPNAFTSALEAAAKQSGDQPVCCDMAVTSYLHENTPSMYMYGKTVAEFKRGPLDVLLSHVGGKKLKIPSWHKQLLSANEVVLSWYELEGTKPLRITSLTGSLKISDITDVEWPTACDPAEDKKRSRCFAVSCGEMRYNFASSKASEALSWVRCINLLRTYV